MEACPRCGIMQEGGKYCAMCGLDLRKPLENGELLESLEKDAQYCYLQGENAANGMFDIPLSHEQALVWYRKAADLGHPTAMIRLGKLYARGWAVEKDLEKANALFQKGLTLLREAAERGDVNAQFDLGECYRHGDGVQQNWAEAATWYHMAADQGHGDAQCRLGNFYAFGMGVEKNEEKGRQWFARAVKTYERMAQMGDAFAKSCADSIRKDWKL